MRLDKETYRLTDPGRYGRVAAVIGIIGLIVTAAGFFVNPDQAFHSYLTGYFFWLSIGLGGLFFAMLHHLVGARWSVVLRRMAEAIAMTMPLMALFFIPLLFGFHDLYHWSHGDVQAHDELLRHKSPYLNIPFFIVRAVIYFAIWIILARVLYRTSIRQDSGHTDELQSRMRRISAPGMVLFAFTISFAAFDWLMSLDAHWYSTIFGVYAFAGSLVGIMCFLTLTALYLRKKGVLDDVINVEHYHDLGRLTFAFTIFWAYMAYSQYFLIWYGNIPEETTWFIFRWQGSWRAVSLVLVFGHFIIPFFILITRFAKRNPVMLKILVGWLFFMHLVDIYWIVMPTLHEQGAYISWIDFSAVLGIGGAFCWYFWRKFASAPLIPVGDPKLRESIVLSKE